MQLPPQVGEKMASSWASLPVRGVRMRLWRAGRRNLPYYRVVATDSRKAPRGKYIERLGSYDPVPDKQGNKHLRLDTKRVKYWLAVGAQPSDTVAKLLSKVNLLPPAPHRSRLSAAIREKKL